MRCSYRLKWPREPRGEPVKRRSKVGGKRANAKDRKSVKRATKLGEPVSSRVPLCERPAESLLQLLQPAMDC